MKRIRAVKPSSMKTMKTTPKTMKTMKKTTPKAMTSANISPKVPRSKNGIQNKHPPVELNEPTWDMHLWNSMNRPGTYFDETPSDIYLWKSINQPGEETTMEWETKLFFKPHWWSIIETIQFLEDAGFADASTIMHASMHDQYRCVRAMVFANPPSVQRQSWIDARFLRKNHVNPKDMTGPERALKRQSVEKNNKRNQSKKRKNTNEKF